MGNCERCGACANCKEEAADEAMASIDNFCDSMDRLYKNKPTVLNIKATLWAYRYAIFQFLLDASYNEGEKQGIAQESETERENEPTADPNDLD